MISLFLSTVLLLLQAQDIPPAFTDQAPIPANRTLGPAIPFSQADTTVAQVQRSQQIFTGSPPTMGESAAVPGLMVAIEDAIAVKPQPIDEKRQILNNTLQASKQEMEATVEALKAHRTTFDQYEDAKRRNFEVRLALLAQYPDSLATDYPEMFSLLGIYREAEKENLRMALMQYFNRGIELLKEKPEQPIPPRKQTGGILMQPIPPLKQTDEIPTWIPADRVQMKEKTPSSFAVMPEGLEPQHRINDLRTSAKENVVLLVLSKTGLNDSDLANLVDSTTLEYLVMSDNEAITNAGLDILAEITSLRGLFLKGTSVTKEGVEEFKKKRPHVYVEF